MRRRFLCLLLVAAMLAPPAQAGTGRGVTVWDSDRVITSPVEVLQDDTLRIAAGVNITFDPGDAPESGAGMPALGVAGRLEVCGTAAGPVRFYSTPALWKLFEEPDCIILEGKEDRESLYVRNASFTDIVLAINYERGEFRDCRFDRCTVDIHFSAVRFVNCTFIFSSVRNDQAAFARGGPQPSLSGCRFDPDRSLSHPPAWRYGEDYNREAQYFGEAAFEDWGGALVEDCTIRGHSIGIYSEYNFARVRGCTVSGCGYGIMLGSDFPQDTAEVLDCTVTGSSGMGAYIIGRVIMSNCTVTGGEYGVWLEGRGGPASILSGNRIYNNSVYGVVVYGAEAELGDTIFENGSVANGVGRLERWTGVMVRVVDPLGRPVECQLYWTDRLGNFGGASNHGNHTMNLRDYSIDSSGNRLDYFPYTVYAELAGRSDRTTVPVGVDNMTLVLHVLTDLAVVNISLQPESPAEGDRTAISVRVENLGYYPDPDGYISFMLDGKEMDRQRLPWLRGGDAVTVYSLPWTATPGKHKLRVLLDPGGAITESNRSNNEVAINFTVEQTTPPGLADKAWPYLQVLLVIAAMGLVVVAVLRRRKGGPEGSSAPPPA